jgi:hypothetical protein
MLGPIGHEDFARRRAGIPIGRMREMVHALSPRAIPTWLGALPTVAITRLTNYAFFERAVCGYAFKKTNGRGHAMQKVSVNAK